MKNLSVFFVMASAQSQVEEGEILAVLLKRLKINGTAFELEMLKSRQHRRRDANMIIHITFMSAQIEALQVGQTLNRLGDGIVVHLWATGNV